MLASLAGTESSLPVFSLPPAGGAGKSSLPTWPGAARLTVAAGAAPSAELLNLPGFSSVPQKLLKKIVAKEYVDICELLPEMWQIKTESSCCHAKRLRRALVTDINVWTECFATMAAVLSAAYPDKAPQLFAYLRIITKASRNFESSAWASYEDDRTGRRPTGPRERSVSADICRLFNSTGGSRCKFPMCRYAHLCIRCRRAHPVSECSERRQQQTTTPQGATAPAPQSSSQPAV